MNACAETRLYVNHPLDMNAAVGLEPNQVHYLRIVLRLKTGDQIILFNGRDGEWLARIEAMGKNGCIVEMVEKLRQQTMLPELHLLFAPVKKNRLSMIIEKATELGATRITPCITERTRADRLRLPRLLAIAAEAAEQCERLDVPHICEPQKLDQILTDWPDDSPLLVCAESGDAPPLAKILTQSPPGPPGPACFLIGPEGGFSPAELEKLAQYPFVRFAGLGPRILRAETAAIAALCCWQSCCGDWEMRPPHRI